MNALFRQLRRSLRATAWIARDGLRDAKSRVAAIAALNAVGVATAASSIGTVLLYANRAAAGRPITLLGTELATDHPSSVLLVGVSVVVVGLLSAACLLGAQVLVQRVARHYQRRCIRRLLHIGCHPDADAVTDAAAAAVGRPISLNELVSGATRFSAYALRSLVEAMLPALYATACVAYLFWIDATVTLILAGLAALYLVPLALVYRDVARRHRVFREQSPAVMGGIKAGMAALLSGGGPARDERVWGPALVDQPEFDRLQDSLYGRLLARSKVVFLNGAFLLLCLFTIFVFAALSSDLRAVHWTTILAYIIALRLAWQGLGKVTTLLTMVSRFFPDYERLAAVLQAADATPAGAPDRPPPLETPIEVPLEEDASSWRVERGSVLLVVAPGVDGVPALRRASAALASNGAVCTRRLDLARPLPGARLVDQALGLDAPRDRVEGYRRRLGELGVADEIDALPEGVETALTARAAAALSREASFAAGAAWCLDGEPAVVVQSLRGLAGLKPSFQKAWIDAHRGNALVLVTTAAGAVFDRRLDALRPRLDGALVVDETGTVRGGSLEWLEANRVSIDGNLKPRDILAPVEDELDEDLLEDM